MVLISYIARIQSFLQAITVIQMGDLNARMGNEPISDVLGENISAKLTMGTQWAVHFFN